MKINNLWLVVIVLFAIISCKKELTPPEYQQAGSMTDMTLDGSFDFQTTKKVNAKISMLFQGITPLKGIAVNFVNPENNEVLFTGSTNNSGELSVDVLVPSYLDQLILRTKMRGIEPEVTINISHGYFTYAFGSLTNMQKAYGEFNQVKGLFGVDTLSSYATMGTWNSLGVPNYLEPVDDVIPQSLLDDLDESLPEQSAVFNHHPEYLSDTMETNISVEDSSEAWITFVDEGAGNKNAIGFYTYPTGNPPADEAAITNAKLIFPNVSIPSAGGLVAGNKVYLDTIPANTTIAFFLVRNGWQPTTQSVKQNQPNIYGDSYLNTFASEDTLKQHCILLHDMQRDILILGFEDIRRTYGSCDHDFNDALFYLTIVPFECVKDSCLPKVDPQDDEDGDGVADPIDDYPNDPNKAFNNHVMGTLAFEDLWPAYGDFDFNDLVVGYDMNYITNAQNAAVQIDAVWIVRAIGAGFNNSFGIELPVSPTDISSVTGGATLLGNTNAVIIAFDDAYEILNYDGGGVGVNTWPGDPYTQPDTIEQSIIFSSPQMISNLGLPPYNPFIRVDGEADKEVHLMGYEPTEFASSAYFGTHMDNSIPAQGQFYISVDGLPWAIHLPVDFEYPKEMVDILEAYSKFDDWAQSNGDLFSDWYLDNPGYRDATKIYSAPQ